MTTWAPSVDTVTLFVDDLPAAKRFYADVFGLPVAFEDADSVVFRFGSTLVNLLAVSAASELITPASPGRLDTPARSVMTIEVDDVDAVTAHVTARGAVLLNGPMDRPWGVRTSSFRDPSGHIWELAAPIASPEPL